MERDRLVSPPEPPRRPGRPRSEEAHDAILTAAIALTREVGFDAVTMDGIASRAGVGKATVYRRWSSKETLVAEAVGRIVSSAEPPDTGTTRGDLLALLHRNLRMYQDPATGMLLSSLVAAMARSEEIARAVRSGFLASRRTALRQVLERALARGELRKGTDLDVAVDLLSAPLFYRLLATGERLDEALLPEVVDVVLRGLAPDARAPLKPRARGARR